MKDPSESRLRCPLSMITSRKARLVSVIVPVRNRRELLRQTLNCISHQQTAQVEVLVIDDGSSDGSAEIATDVLKQLQLAGAVITQARIGVSAARNLGLSRSRGEFIKFLDSDDLLAPGTLATQISAHPRLPQRSIGYVGTMYLKANAILPSGFPRMEGNVLGALLNGGFFGIHAPLVPWKVFDEIGGFDNSLKTMEDDDLWVRAALAGWQFYFNPESAALYRQYSNQLTDNFFANRRASIQHLCKLMDIDLDYDHSIILDRRLKRERDQLAALSDG